ncbi:HMA2 domain-containing protein [Egbenema bharatensis]|uniref:HMA2 domain-containing protein n=1 Tax=Egbenema bharatensis TaxID=3463334 RepID=UPI003A8956DB
MTNAAAATPNLEPAGSLDVAPRVGHFLEEYGEISAILPVLVGLFVTNRLQLRGVQALMVNLAIAAVARQVVLQLKKQAHHSPAVVSTANGQPGHERTAATASADAVEDYTIVHSTPGRLRLRIPRLLSDPGYAKRLEKLLKAEERVTGVRLNRAAASIVVLYDGEGVSELELGMRLLQILEQAENVGSLDAVATASDS